MNGAPRLVLKGAVGSVIDSDVHVTIKTIYSCRGTELINLVVSMSIERFESWVLTSPSHVLRSFWCCTTGLAHVQSAVCLTLGVAVAIVGVDSVVACRCVSAMSPALAQVSVPI